MEQHNPLFDGSNLSRCLSSSARFSKALPIFCFSSDAAPTAEGLLSPYLPEFKDMVDVSSSEINLTIEQQFRVERACRKIDECDDVEALKQLSKALIVTAARERAFSQGVTERLKE